MITSEEREKAPDLFKEALEVWAEAKAQLAVRGTGRGCKVQARPEVQLSGTLLEGLYRLGVDVNVSDAVALGESFDAKGRYVAEWISDVSWVKPEEWSGIVAVTDSLVEKLKLALKKLWNRDSRQTSGEASIPPAGAEGRVVPCRDRRRPEGTDAPSPTRCRAEERE